MRSPVPQQARRLRSDVPIRRIGNEPPLVHPFAHTVDDRGDLVLLGLRREPLTLVKDQPDLLDLLALLGLLLLRPGDRRDERSGPPVVQDLVGRLPGRV